MAEFLMTFQEAFLKRISMRDPEGIDRKGKRLILNCHLMTDFNPLMMITTITLGFFLIPK